jgi:hypothetical protein
MAAMEDAHRITKSHLCLDIEADELDDGLKHSCPKTDQNGERQTGFLPIHLKDFC